MTGQKLTITITKLTALTNSNNRFNVTFFQNLQPRSYY